MERLAQIKKLSEKDKVWDIVVVGGGATGLGVAVDAAPRIPYGYLTPGHYLLDLVYNPPLTRFLDLGRQRGARILNGEVMFRRQAEASWRIWNE